MKKISLIKLTFLIFFLSANTFAVNKSKTTAEGWCGSVAPSMEWEDQLQRIIANQKAQASANGREQQISYTIPVVVHVVYYNNNAAQNLSAARINSQIAVLNNDFAGNGFGVGTIPAAFSSLKANTNITFCLAKLNPNNNVMGIPGKDSIDARARNWPNPGTTGWARSFIDGTIKPATIWDPNYYLNIWVVPGIQSTTGGTILGYATFPGLTGLDGMPDGAGNELNDGLVCRARYFGTTAGTYGRTSTHEIGHWLGLRHIWGDDSCGTDYVNDTPTALEENYGCPSYPHRSCGNTTSGDMFMNFMDYTDDNCMNMFTTGQSARFQTTMQFGDFRRNLVNSTVCDTVKQKPFAKFNVDKVSSTACATTKKFNFTDKSIFGPTTWSWIFQGGTPATSNVKNPSNVSFDTPGLHDVTLVVTNSRGSSTITKQINVAIVSAGSMPLVEGFEGVAFPPIGWDWINRNGNPAINWDIIDGYSAYGVGSRCMRFDNTTLDGRGFDDDILTPKLNLTGITSSKLKFDVAYAPFYSDAGNGFDESIFDTLEVYITDNCMATSQRIYTKGGTALATFLPGLGEEFYPAANQWRTDSVVIPSNYLNKPNVQIAFRNLGNYGHTIYVDNVNLTSPPTSPTATASFTVSDTAVCIGGSLTFTNTSTASSGSPDSVRWTINGGTPSTSTSTPTVSPVFNAVGTYIISLVAYKSGNPSAAATKSIRVKPNASITLTSGAGTNNQTKCIGNAITSITYSVGGGGTGAGVTGLPGGLTGVYSNGVFTISGAPTGTGTFNYTVTTTGSCTQATATGTIIVNCGCASPPTVTLSSTSGTTCGTTPVTVSNNTFGGSATSVTITENGAGSVGAGSANSSPFSFTYTPSAGDIGNTVTITVTTDNPNALCVAATSTYQLQVRANAAIALSSASGTDAQTKCAGTAITNITYTVSGGGTGAGVTGLPTGVTGSYSGGVFTISGTPTQTGTFNYTVTTTGSCTQATATGSITVNPNATVSLSSAAGTNNQTKCVGTAITNITYTVGGSGTGAGVSGLPTGVTGSYSGGVFTISGTPTQTGTFNYTVTTTGTCTQATATGTITVNANAAIALTSAGGTTAQNLCVSTAIANITYGVSGGGTGAGVTGLPTGVTGSYSGGVFTISGTPTQTGTFNYTVTTTGTCTQATATGSITVNSCGCSSAPAVTLSGGSGSTCSNTALTLTGNTFGGSATSVTITENGAGSVGAGSANSSPFSITYTPAAGDAGNTVTITVTTNNPNGAPCVAASSTYQLTVNSAPGTPGITQSGDTLYSSVIVAGANYEWYKGGILTATTLTPYYKLASGGSYTLKITSGGCTSVESVAFAAVYTGIRNNKQDVAFTVIPNPSNGDFEVRMSSNVSKKFSLVLYNLTGQEIIKDEMNVRPGNNVKKINLNGLEKGVYVLSVIGDSGIASQNIIIQ